jgi:hypothetical protein
MNRKKILLLKKANLKYDVRTQRRAKYLEMDYDLSIGCLTKDPELKLQQHSSTSFGSPDPNLIIRAIRKGWKIIDSSTRDDSDFQSRVLNDPWRKRMLRDLSEKNFDLVIASDIDALPTALDIAKGAPVLLDLHEHATTELEGIPGWVESHGKYKKWLCETYIKEANSLVTVSESLAEVYANEFGLLKPTVIRNAHPFVPRTRQQSNQNPLKFIHTGITGPNRRLEIHGELALELGTPFTVFMLLKDVNFRYTKEFSEFAKQIDNFIILPEVAPNEIVSEIAKYEAGIYLMDQTTTQMQVTLPNKFFEYLQARLPIFTGGLPEMDKLVSKFEIGVPNLSLNPRESALQIKSLDVNWIQIGKNLDEAAYELSFEAECRILDSVINELIS